MAFCLTDILAKNRATGRLGWLRGAGGAILGIAVSGLITRLLMSAGNPATPWLLAPVGASAVLVFALPASPLAQPWPVFGGDMLSALIGLTVGHFVPIPALAAALAIGAAIGTMSLARCLHPPGGACALLGALGSPLIAAQGWSVLIVPLALNLTVLLGAAWLYNNLTGHRWPHQLPAVAPIPPQGWAGSYQADDLDAVLADWDEVLDVSRDDLDALFRAVERRVQRRWQDDLK